VTFARATTRKDAHGMHKAARGPSQISQAPIPDMRSSPRARIALIGEPLLLKQLQPIEARRMKKR
jgi:hypothetical protein